MSLLIVSLYGFITYRVSADGDITDDEDDDQDNYSHDSFIDDRTSPTFMATQSATSRPDMMAIYRSLAFLYLSLACSHDKLQLPIYH